MCTLFLFGCLATVHEQQPAPQDLACAVQRTTDRRPSKDLQHLPDWTRPCQIRGSSRNWNQTSTIQWWNYGRPSGTLTIHDLLLESAYQVTSANINILLKLLYIFEITYIYSLKSYRTASLVIRWHRTVVILTTWWRMCSTHPRRDTGTPQPMYNWSAWVLKSLRSMELKQDGK